MVELFFDLIFVFAITQLSHLLLTHLSLQGSLQTLLLMLAVWTVWSYTAWATNFLDPETIPVRLLLIVLMLAGFVVAMAIPSAFGAGGPTFAVGYVLMHLIRSGFLIWAARAEPLVRRRNYQRNLFWVLVTAIIWLTGAFAEPGTRLYFWMSAVAVEFAAPLLLYWTPGLGASRTSEWTVNGSHMAERCALFVIIALGESLLLAGSTFTDLHWSGIGGAGLLSAFAGTVGMWWIYFHEGAEHAARHIAASSDPGNTARISYSFLHIPIVAGVVAAAVGNELVLTHPGHAETAAIVTIIGGPALFLSGCTLFKWRSHDRRTPPLSHTIGLIALAALYVAAQTERYSSLQLGIGVTAILVAVAAWETLALRRPRRD